MSFLAHCQKTDFPEFLKASHSSTARNTLWYWQVGRERLYFTHIHLGVQAQKWNISRQPAADLTCWPKGISPCFTLFPMPPFSTPGSRHESTRTLHAFHHHLCLHTPRTLWILPLTDHTCHFTHLPTSPSRSGCFFLPSCSSTNRNLSYGCD